jgi:DNA repair photolyase
MLRLPLAVKPVFLEWLERTQALSQAKVEALIRAVRGGDLYNAAFGQRMRGTGPIAEQIGQMFQVFKKRYALEGPLPAYDTSQFRPPRATSGQMRLF